MPLYNYDLARANYHDILHPAPAPAGPSGTLPQAGGLSYNPAYGGIPVVPNPVSTAGTAIGGNVGNLGSLYGLSTGTGQASAAGAGAQLQQNLPGALGALGTGLGNTNQLLAGQIPTDVLTQLQTQAAARGVATGSPGSPNSNASYLQALGLTGLDLQQTGLKNLGSLIGMTPTGPQFNPASMFVTPGAQQGAQELSNLYGAAPIPGVAAAANMNALQAALRAGRSAANPSAPSAIDVNSAIGGSPSGALGYGFGTRGSQPTASAGPMGTAFAGPADPTADPTQWMNPNESQLWNQMTPDQQYEEALMGYPSFFQDQSSTSIVPAGSDTTDTLSQSVDASNPDYWDLSLYE